MSRNVVTALALLALASSGCSNEQPAASPSTGSTTSTITSAAPASTHAPAATATSATSGHTTSGPASSSPAARASASATATPTRSASAPASAGPLPGLPDELAGWTKVEAETRDGWIIAGYAKDLGIVQLRARKDGVGAPGALVKQLTSGEVKPVAGMPCATGPTVRACAQKRGPVTVVATSVDLQTKDLAPLITAALKTVK